MAKKKERIKSEKKEYEQDHQWQFKFLLDQFSKESDRAAVIELELVKENIEKNF